MPFKDPERAAEYKRQYYEKHKQRLKECKHQWYVEHSQLTKDRAKKWKAENPEKVKAGAKRYRQLPETREKQKIYNKRTRARHPDEAKARSALRYALDTGKIVRPAHCEQCHKQDSLHAHHDDYNKPLEVRWLCRQCHVDWHKHNEPIRRNNANNIPC